MFTLYVWILLGTTLIVINILFQKPRGKNSRNSILSYAFRTPDRGPDAWGPEQKTVGKFTPSEKLRQGKVGVWTGGG